MVSLCHLKNLFANGYHLTMSSRHIYILFICFCDSIDNYNDNLRNELFEIEPNEDNEKAYKRRLAYRPDPQNRRRRLYRV